MLLLQGVVFVSLYLKNSFNLQEPNEAESRICFGISFHSRYLLPGIQKTFYSIQDESDLCNCAKTEIIESTAPSQQRHIRGTIFLEHPVDYLAHDRFVMDDAIK